MNVKKLISMVLALVMLLAMSATAMAYTITAPNNGHTYEVYQIFIGDLNDAGVLTNIKWGLNGTGEKDEAVAQNILNELDAIDDDASDVAKLNVIRQYANLTSTLYGKLGEMKDAETNETEFVEKLQDVPSGYYLIKDEAGSLTGEHEAYTLYIVQIVDNVTITPKSSVPTVEKKVDDKNDSNTTEDVVKWEDSADYDFNDDVPFKLTATLGDNLEGYNSYKIVFHDTLSAGLTYNDDFTVTIDGNPVTGFVDASSGTTLTFTCEDVLALGAEEGSVIVVNYTAKLNGNAVMGSAGNPNTVYLEFSNNPYIETETGNTTTDTVIVFTYKVIVTKVDQDGDELAGAKFTLEKKMADGNYVPVGEEKVTTDVKGGNVLVWERLDDGDYILEEDAPAGYNRMKPIKFSIVAGHVEVVEEPSDIPTLESLNGNVVTGEVEFAEVEFAVDKGEGSLSTTIVNQKGATLPETGAQGTKMLYIVGGILVAAAVVLLIVKRRMDSAE